jgi:predicted dinucleotide-binding enzyme
MTEKTKQTYTLGIVGGTGKEGKGLAYRWLLAGHK